ncbi:2-amino-4-hydroxy-6-hydroxymethyldihydropteridine diphosphokinase [Methylovorus sp. MM2]|uniref:2-amino-4-hydroxy-6- hydroxymethyldihydropteridine diphosphokinase n=1 Tax=Methylovorus sp. MM2 TaxID=1848038 RepID=UPI0007E194B6|nr:2-amino-4-hydroxy-6-hydroxymethyldihydropteridine diphosphokinase [Methylovorus sp. MM2]OAM51453.1 2-amino-4-hydroxy-6-hydroxymethyldihydropteridine diphosphokinase [Methylovorus sp. MM2]
MSRAYIALGSNLKSPEEQVSNALAELDSITGTKLIKASSLYRTAPIGYDNQPDFINAVAEIETSLPPLDLLHALLALETTYGRERPFPNAPRVLDLDLLTYEDIVLNSETLTLPHPRMHERGFVMIPLAEIAPDLVIGQHGKITKLAQDYANQGVERI